MEIKSKFTVLRNPIALIAAALIILSMRFYWWRVWFVEQTGGIGIEVYPYSFVGRIPEPSLVPDIGHSLQWFFGVLVILTVAIVIGSFLKKKIGIPLILVPSFMCLAIHHIFRMRLLARIETAAGGTMIELPELPLEGQIFVEGYTIATNFGLGYDLILLAGIIGILSVILHDRIRIKLKRS